LLTQQRRVDGRLRIVMGIAGCRAEARDREAPQPETEPDAETQVDSHVLESRAGRTVVANSSGPFTSVVVGRRRAYRREGGPGSSGDAGDIPDENAASDAGDTSDVQKNVRRRRVGAGERTIARLSVGNAPATRSRRRKRGQNSDDHIP